MEKSFMLGDWFDALAIRGYLERRDLINSIEGSEGSETYSLDDWKVTIKYDKYYHTTRVIITGDFPSDLVSELEEIGELSRIKGNINRGMATAV
jgi:hypothetical protein